jgi:CubicO group peptidase (beta-lactamase class C family)
MKNLVIITIIWLVSGMLLANLTDDLAEVQAEFDVIGMSVLVLDENSTEFSYYGGLSDIERQIPISVETKYRIASISKLITATAVMQLWEDNLLELNTDISEYLDYEVRNPHYPQQPITLKQLMTHTSSLRDSDAYFNFLYDSYGTSNPPNLKELLTENGVYYAENLWSYKAPGETDNWSYCNLGAGILATIVEKISGQHFQEYCRQNFFEPLQIDACWQDLENLEDINYLAVLYRYNQQGTAIPQADNYGGQLPPSINWEAIPVGHNGICYAPQGGLRISGRDLAKFTLAYMNDGSYNNTEILQPETLEIMLTEFWEGWGLGGFFRKMGLQFQITNDLYEDFTMLGHAGEAYGLLSDMYFDQEQQFGIIFIMNGANYNYGEGIFYDVEEAVFEAVANYLFATANSVEESSENANIGLYPNPARDFVTITSTKQLGTKVKIYNCKGQLVRQLPNNVRQWNLTDKSGIKVTSGIYFIHFDNVTNDEVKKIVVLP